VRRSTNKVCNWNRSLYKHR